MKNSFVFKINLYWNLFVDFKFIEETIIIQGVKDIR